MYLFGIRKLHNFPAICVTKRNYCKQNIFLLSRKQKPFSLGRQKKMVVYNMLSFPSELYNLVHLHTPFLPPPFQFFRTIYNIRIVLSQGHCNRRNRFLFLYVFKLVSFFFSSLNNFQSKFVAKHVKYLQYVQTFLYEYGITDTVSIKLSFLHRKEKRIYCSALLSSTFVLLFSFLNTCKGWITPFALQKIYVYIM